MRRLLTFNCQGAELGATLEAADARIGVVMVTGGSQTRIGSHRMYERLAAALAGHGIACLRFDRRGVGDSGGEDPGFRGSGPDLAAATALLRGECPTLERVYGFGLCDGATAIALFGDEAGLDGLILVNPWLVEAASGEPAPAAIRRHYRDRLRSVDGWKRLLSGTVNYRKLLKGLMRLARGQNPSVLAQETAAALARHRLPAQFILATGDATAVAAENEIRSKIFNTVRHEVHAIGTDSHTFARRDDDRALVESVLAAVRRLEDQAS